MSMRIVEWTEWIWGMLWRQDRYWVCGVDRIVELANYYAENDSLC